MNQPIQNAYIFSSDGEENYLALTYKSLDTNAMIIASALQDRYKTRNRILLLFEPGLDFKIAFFGSLCAGMIPVTSYLPVKDKNSIIGFLIGLSTSLDLYATINFTNLTITLLDPFIMAFRSAFAGDAIISF